MVHNSHIVKSLPWLIREWLEIWCLSMKMTYPFMVTEMEDFCLRWCSEWSSSNSKYQPCSEKVASPVLPSTHVLRSKLLNIALSNLNCFSNKVFNVNKFCHDEDIDILSHRNMVTTSYKGFSCYYGRILSLPSRLWFYFFPSMVCAPMWITISRLSILRILFQTP